jgi:hypothetical protein
MAHWEDKHHAAAGSLKSAVFLEGAQAKARKSQRIFGATP